MVYVAHNQLVDDAARVDITNDRDRIRVVLGDTTLLLAVSEAVDLVTGLAARLGELGEPSPFAAQGVAESDAVGYATVKLPERNVNGEWPAGRGVVYYDSNDHEIWYGTYNRTPEQARAAAAALIAAANSCASVARIGSWTSMWTRPSWTVTAAAGVVQTGPSLLVSGPGNRTTE